ncbi:MAG: 50S ribosomal protein L25 [Blautia sp.]|nr:50S ribosomal protein L25 [Blautia sp.]
MNTLKTERRDLAEKAKKLRREGFATGNLFGHKIEGSIPVKFVAAELEKAMKGHGKGAKLALDLDGQIYQVLVKEIQFNTMKKQIEEIDFQALVGDEMVRSTVEIVIENHDKVPEGILQQDLEEISYSALPSDLVEKVAIDVAGMKVGDVVTVGDLEIAKNEKIHLHTDPHTVILAITAANSVKEEEAEEVKEEAEEENK